MASSVLEEAAPHGDGTPEASVRHAVRIRDLKHFFSREPGAKPSIDVAKLDVDPGEIVIMTGPSGSGKTTLLTLIGALRTIQEGTVEVLGRSLTGLSAAELVEVRRGMGFIFQAHNLFASLTALQNVCMALQLHDWPAAAQNDRAVEVLTALGLGHRIRYKPGALSGGQRQRVAIARAISNRPKLILADEPTAALDAESSQDVIELLEKLARDQRAAILLVTHDNRILKMADRIVNMVGGRIVSDVRVHDTLTICTYLKQCHLFAGLAADALTRLAEKFAIARYAPGEAIIRQGDRISENDKFYLLRRGQVEVFVQDAGGGPPRLVNTLGEGDYFGEIALIRGGERTATVTARDEVEVWTLDKVNFDATLASSDSFKDQIYKVLFQRQ
jgi:putative ABC transport system ATP-binding protein